MSSKNGGDGGGQAGLRSDLGRADGCGTIREDGLTPEEAEAIEKLAEVFVDAMMKLEQEHGLTPRKMKEYYAGRMDLKKDKEGKP